MITMTIRHYDHRHDTVAEVRACTLGRQPRYGTHETGHATATNGQPTLPGFVTHPASEKSINWLKDLMRDRDDSGVQVGRVMETLMDVMDGKQVSQREVSDAIDVLVKCPLKNDGPQRGLSRAESVPSGRYCLEQDGVLKFYQVDRPTEGRWAGWVFTKQLIGAPGDYRRIRLNKQQARPVLEAISQDVKGALRRYGLEHKVCGVCSSPLTNEESLAYGIGPICRAKGGW